MPAFSGIDFSAPPLGGDWGVVVAGESLRVSRSRKDEVARRLGVT